MRGFRLRKTLLKLLYVFIDSMNTFVSVIYRPPDAPANSFREVLNTVQEKLNHLTLENRTPDLYIMGDFNLPNIDWEIPDATQELSIVNQQACLHLLEFINKTSCRK